jgi:hypothetical protein
MRQIRWNSSTGFGVGNPGKRLLTVVSLGDPSLTVVNGKEGATSQGLIPGFPASQLKAGKKNNVYAVVNVCGLY